MAGVTYDSGALVAAERNDRRMWARHAVLLRRGLIPTVPAPVVGEVWRGGPRAARLAQVLALCVVEPMSEQQARAVGELLSRAGVAGVVDATVVEGAARRGDAIVTGDAADIERLVRAAGVVLQVMPI